MNSSRRGLHYTEESKIASMLRRREDTGSTISFGRDLRTEVKQERANSPIVPPPPSFSYSATAHKQKYKKPIANKSFEDSKTEFINKFIGTTVKEGETRIIDASGLSKTGNIGTVSSMKEQADCCVTVFGYSSSEKAEVLNEMGKYGRIVEYQEKGKNWMNIKYSSTKEARNALQSHGVILSKIRLMIGVKKCEDRDFYHKAIGNVRYPAGEVVNKERISPIKTYHFQRDDRGWLGKIFEFIFNW